MKTFTYTNAKVKVMPIIEVDNRREGSSKALEELKGQITMAAKVKIIVTPVVLEYSPDARGRVGLLTWRKHNSSIHPIGLLKKQE